MSWCRSSAARIVLLINCQKYKYMSSCRSSLMICSRISVQNYTWGRRSYAVRPAATQLTDHEHLAACAPAVQEAAHDLNANSTVFSQNLSSNYLLEVHESNSSFSCISIGSCSEHICIYSKSLEEARVDQNRQFSTLSTSS